MSNNYVKRFIPDVYKENDELKALYDVQAEEMLKIHTDKRNVFRNNFIKTANINGIIQYENVFNVDVNADYTVEERRENVKNKMLWKPPFTRQRLMDILKNIWGVGNYVFEIKYEDFEVIIDINTINPIVYLQFQKNVRNVIPSNMLIIFSIQYTYLYLNRNYTYQRIENEDLTYGDLSQYAEEE